MFKRKRLVQNTSFTASLSLPEYIPKDNLLGKVVFDYELERVGQVIDWTYTPEGQISLVVSGKDLKKVLGGGDSLLIPFECIERVGKFILLSQSMDSLLPKKAFLENEDQREKAIAALMEKFEQEEAKELEEENPREVEKKTPKPKKRSTRRKKKPKKELKAFNELEEELFANILEPQESPSKAVKPKRK